MSAKLQGANDADKLKDLATKTYKEQTVWFLNAFWEDGLESQAETFWKYVQSINKLDTVKADQGSDVDELLMHRFLEQFKETMTVKEMRDSLRESGAVTEFKVRNIPLVHYLIFRYKKDFKVLVNSSQGNKEIDEAQKMLIEVQALFQAANSKAEIAKAALKEADTRHNQAQSAEQVAKARESEAKNQEQVAQTRAADAVARESDAKAAQLELEAALKDLKEQEDTRNRKTEDLKKKSEEGGVVSQNKAKAELAAHLAADPLPLARAKITQEAAVKKADKATQSAVEARSAAQAAKTAAEASAREATQARSDAEEQARQAAAAKAESERATAAAEDAAEEARQKVDQAEAYLNEVKSKPGSGKGTVWWLQRELHETKAYLPERKGGYRK